MANNVKTQEYELSLTKRGRRMLTLSRVFVYIALIFLTILCLFSFYLMIINASRTHSQIQQGFTLIPGTNLIQNFKNAVNDASINIPQGMWNSLVVAVGSATLTTYFSALTAISCNTHFYVSDV